MFYEEKDCLFYTYLILLNEFSLKKKNYLYIFIIYKITTHTHTLLQNLIKN